jgi:CDP-glucose 4,6-dehydratase
MRAHLRVYDGARVLVFGHTGFVGGWLALWLQHLGARVCGVALPPEDEPNLFRALGLESRIDHRITDIRERAAVVEVLRSARPDVVFHLAAQSCVRRSYRLPIETLATNVMGTAHVLEALRATPGVRSCVVVSSDKCYASQPSRDGYCETDSLGGDDVYSASKAAAELVIASYRRAFLGGSEPAVLVASARAGNIIGGGDWGEDRIVPDCVRSIVADEPLRMRNPRAVRPWQHVLDAVCGYLLLGAHLAEGRAEFAEAWNFGPPPDVSKTVSELVRQFHHEWGEPTPAPIIASEHNAPAETSELRLDSSKARARLGWESRLGFEESIAWTARWYRAFYRDRASAPDATIAQMALYEERF